MVQPVTAILSGTGELAAKARLFTQDTNEASLMVGKVVSRAFNKAQDGDTDDAILGAMRRDLDRMIEQMRKAARA
jgi:hypothetical protein